MRKNNKKKVLTGLVAFSYVFTAASPTALAISESQIVLSQSLADRVKSSIQLPENFTSVAIGNEGSGNSYYNEQLKEFHIEGSGGQIGKDTGSTDSYQLVSHEVKGDATIVARLKDFDMSKATYGQAGIILRSNDDSNNADYLAVYVEPSANQYRYAFRDTTTGGTGAANLNGLTAEKKDVYIKVVKSGTSFKFYVSENEDFSTILAQGGQTITTAHDTWNAGFVVGNGNSTEIATATFDNVEITDSTGVVYTSKEQPKDEVTDNRESFIPTGFNGSVIGTENKRGYANFDTESKEFTVEGSGIEIAKDSNKTDNYYMLSHKVSGDSTIVARLKDFDMSNAKNGQAGIILRSDDATNKADYLAVYVEPASNQYRYAYRDNTTGGTGAAALNGLTAEKKDVYIKIVKAGTSFKFYISEKEDFSTLLAQGGQTVNAEHATWNAGFVVSNGGSSNNAIAKFDNVEITDSTGTVYTTKEVSNDVVEDDTLTGVYLPKRFIDSHIGNNDSIGRSNFNKETKQFEVSGSGTYVGKDMASTDNYQFVSYQVKGDGYIVARMADFDMSNAQYGQAGVFARSDNNSNNADYFGVYVEPSKKEYRYAYRDNAAGRSGAAAIAGLDENSKNKYIKIEKEGTSFRYSISDDITFPEGSTLTNTQTVSSASTTWSFGFVVSNGGSASSAKAVFDNVKIGTAIGTYYDSTLDLRPVDTVENLQAVAGDAEVNLTWDIEEKADRYILKRSTEVDGTYETIATLNANENSYNDSNLTNFRTYYYKIVAANGEGESYDSAAVSAIPNNSNIENIQYENNAAVFTMIEEPNDTVYSKNTSIKGSTDKDGTISIKVNGSLVKENEAKNAGEEFEQNVTLMQGRNTIEISQVTADGKKSLKTYNLVCLTKDSFQIIVDKNYSGEDGSILKGSESEESEGIKVYKSITAAISSISKKNTERKTIFVRNGVYKEKTTVEVPYVSIVGEDSEKTIWTFDAANGTVNPDDANGNTYGTSKSASVTIKTKAVGFTAENITFENSYVEKGEHAGDQAVALNNQADKSIFVNCRFIGNQDTLLADASSTSPARQYYYNCYIEGDVDFIFGRAQAVFDNCDIASYNRNSSNNGYITAADTWDKDAYGYLIMNSRLIGLDNIASETVCLGRPWRPSSQTEKMTPSVVYVNNYMGDHITTKGWDDMTATSLAKDSRFFEFASFGPGARSSSTRNVLSIEEASEYTMEKVFSVDAAKKADGSNAYADNWNPTLDTNDVNMNTLYNGGNGEEIIDAVPVISIELNKTLINCKVGDIDTLEATINPDNATNKTVTWSSDNSSVVSVDQNGNITALSSGTATIKAVVSGKEATCIVNVETNDKPEIFAEDKEIEFNSEFDAKAGVTASDTEDGDLTEEIKVIENTVDTTVSGTYKVVYEVKDSDNNVTTKEISVIVKKPILVNKIELQETSIILDTEKEYQLNATVSPSEAHNKTLTWSSDNTEIATVDENGKITAKSVGTTYVIAASTDGSKKTVKCKVTVVEMVEGIEINSEKTTINTKEQLQLTVGFKPANVTNTKVYWSSNDTSVATVSSSGKVKGIAPGKATITVRSADGNKIANIEITVVAAVKSVSIASSLNLNAGDSQQLAATINPSDAANKKVTWSSDDTTIATVDENGNVTAVGAGTTKIWVKTDDGGKTDYCKVTVKQLVNNVKINSDDLTLNVKEKQKLTATLNPSNVSNKKVTWKSSDTSVATVSSSGEVKGVGAGTATITVITADGNKTDEIKVTVKNPVTSIKISKSSMSLTLSKNQTGQLSVKINPTAAEVKKITWSSENKDIVKVDQDGNITPVSIGSAKVMVVVEDMYGNKYDTTSTIKVK